MLPIESMMVVVGAAAQAPASGAGFTVQLPSGGDTAESVPVFGSSNKTAKLLVELPRVRAQNEIPSYADASRGPKLLYPVSEPQSLLWDAWICSAVVLPQRAPSGNAASRSVIDEPAVQSELVHIGMESGVSKASINLNS